MLAVGKELDFEISTDEELVLLSQQNNAASFLKLFERYNPFIKVLSKKFFIYGASEEDVLQEAYIGFVKAIRDFRIKDGDSFKPFAFLCCRRQVITAIKTANRMKHDIFNKSLSLECKFIEEGNVTLVETTPNVVAIDPLQHLLQKEGREELINLLMEKLTTFEIDALNLVLEGLNHEQAGEIMGVSGKGIQNAMYRIRKKIRRYRGYYLE